MKSETSEGVNRTEAIEKAKKNLQIARRIVADPRTSMLPPKIVYNKITLQPLKVSDDTDTRDDAHDNAHDHKIKRTTTR